jgi:hypothetical protein
MNNLSWFAAASVAALALSPWPAAAQFGDGLTQSAIAIQAYEKSAERLRSLNVSSSAMRAAFSGLALIRM